MMKANMPRLLLLVVAVAALTGCGGAVDGMGAQPQPSKGDTSGAGLPAITQPTSTATVGKSVGAIPNTWLRNSRTSADGVQYRYSYPPTWSADLVYCPSGGQQMGSHLPSGCASTDFLFGQKALDVNSSLKPASGKRMTVTGKQAVTEIDTPFDSSKTARTYTVMVYGNAGAPIFGLVTYIGPGTSEADQQAILATLDGIASTLSVEK